MRAPSLLFRNEGHALHVTLNRPECGNLITMQMMTTLAEGLVHLPPETRVVVLSGSGADFCKGRDYEAAPESAHGGRAPTALEVRTRMTSPVVALYSTIRKLPVPALAVVRGAAVGFGTALAGACDLLVASSTARFCLPEMQRALPPTLAMSALHGRVNPRALAYLALSTAEIDAAQAFSVGLASVVFQDSEFEGKLAGLIQALCSHPLDALQGVTQFMRMAPQMGDDARADFGAGIFANVMSSR